MPAFAARTLLLLGIALAVPFPVLAQEAPGLRERLETAPRIGGEDRYILFSPFVQFDGGWASASPRDAISGDDRREGEIRRGRLYTDFAYDRFGGRLTVDFAALESAPITYAYLNYQFSDNLTVQAGHQTLPFSMQQLMGSRSATFAEDGLNSGLQITEGVGLVALADVGNASFQGGVFGGDINNQAFDDGVTLAARATYAPYAADGDAIHLGLGLAAGLDRQETVSVSGGTGVDFVLTSPISSGSFETSGDLRSLNGEFAATAGRLTIQSEYTVSRVESLDREAATLHGGYLGILAFLTDDHRDYEVSSGQFERVKPRQSVWDGGIGAVEIGARLDYLDLADDADAGRQIAATGIVNWYPTDTLRFTATHAHTRVTDGPDRGARIDATLLRAAIIY